MPDISAISAILSSVKSATDLAKIIKQSDLSLSEAETKLKLAELISALADVMLELADVQDLITKKEDRIKDLEDQLKFKATLTFDGKLYWANGDSVPFCPVCYERDNKLHHLSYYERSVYESEAFYSCRICSDKFYTQ